VPLSSWHVTRCSGPVLTSCASTATTGGRSVSGLLTATRRCTSISCAWWPTLCCPQSLVLVVFDARQVLLVLLPMQLLVYLVNHVCQQKVNTGTPLGTSGSIPPALPMICLWVELAILQGSILCALPCSGAASLRTPRPSSTWLITAVTSAVLC
jgi:hypothetical protein